MLLNSPGIKKLPVSYNVSQTSLNYVSLSKNGNDLEFLINMAPITFDKHKMIKTTRKLIKLGI